MSKQKARQRHWLDKAHPSYWKPRSCWRVRVMRDGKPYQWVLTAGKGDSGSTGRALASAEWQHERAKIIKAEEPEYDESGLFINFRTPEEEFQHYQFYRDRADYNNSALSAEMSFDQWKELQEFKEWKSTQRQKTLETQLSGSGMPAGLPDPSGTKPFKELTAVFLAHLKHRFDDTKPNLKTDEDLSKSRFHQYKIALAHLDATEGNTPIKPVGKFHIGEEELAELLGRYRRKCKDEMTASGHSGWWFNERMKTARTFVEFLATGRLLTNKPPNIAKLTKKFKIEENAKPIPLPILKAIWNVADAQFRGFILLALNCGFRQTEISNLTRSHIKVLARQTCISKLRGKTGVELAIPLWTPTQIFIEKYANREGSLFWWENGEDAIIELYGQMKKFREKAGKTMKAALDYSFEHFRDTGASFMDSINPMLTPLYLGQKDARQVKRYVAPIADEKGDVIVPMQLHQVLAEFEKYIDLPLYEP